MTNRRNNCPADLMRLGWGGVAWCPKSKDCDQLLTAVPEPETYATLLTGLGLLGFMSHAARVFE
jgi:hypothetical protein